MARTPYDLNLLTESILTPEARAKLPENGYRNSFTESWEGLRVGILPSAWGIEGRDHKAKWGTSPVVYNLLQNGSLSAGKNQKEVYEAVAEEIKGNGDFVVIPIGVPEAVHTHDVLKHNKLCLKEVAYCEFNQVLQEYCDGFENPKIRTSGDIIEYNKQHAKITMPPREPRNIGETSRLNYIAHTNQKDLIYSHNSPLSAEEAVEACREINRKAGEARMDKFM